MSSTLDLVFSKYSSSITSINDLAPLSKSCHDTLQVNFAVSKLLAEKKLSKPNWRYDWTIVLGLLCVANGIDWASISQKTHVSTHWWRTLGGHSNARRLRDRPSVVSPCRERPPRCTRSTDNALCEWCQIGNSAATERGPSQLSYCRMRQFADKGRTNQSC